MQQDPLVNVSNSIINLRCYIPVNQPLRWCQKKMIRSNTNYKISRILTKASRICKVSIYEKKIVCTNKRTKGNWPNIL